MPDISNKGLFSVDLHDLFLGIRPLAEDYSFVPKY